MSEYTKGPWRWVAVDGGWDGVAEEANPKSIICRLVLNVDAKARLIAAAPDLLEALNNAVGDTELALFEAWLVRVCPSGDVDAVNRQWVESSDHRDCLEEWREQLDAIAKATAHQQANRRGDGLEND